MPLRDDDANPFGRAEKSAGALDDWVADAFGASAPAPSAPEPGPLPEPEPTQTANREPEVR